MNEWPPALQSANMDVAHWAYHAEGAANILVRYIGPHVWPFINTHGDNAALVLRIPKVVNDADAQHTPRPDEFLSRVITNLLPAWSLPCMRKIDIDDTWYDFLTALAKKCEPCRPKERLNSQMNTQSLCIWAMRDHSRPPLHAHSPIVIEIKVRLLRHAHASLNVAFYPAYL